MYGPDRSDHSNSSNIFDGKVIQDNIQKEEIKKLTQRKMR